ncbi:hypothetical protein [Arthrobacter sp.]|uniref:hypothetical protein n=1 Tax=Arthrobacter sp. TaxID=1667 RepID=UPI003A8F5A67
MQIIQLLDQVSLSPSPLVNAYAKVGHFGSIPKQNRVVVQTLTIKQVIGTNVRKLRTSSSLSQSEFGQKVGGFTGKAWSAQTVSVAEAGRREFVAVELLVLCLVLECTIADLMSAADDEMVQIADDAHANGHAIREMAAGEAFGLSRLTDAELAAEVLRRMASEPGGRPEFSAPLNGSTVGSEPDA